MKITTIARIYFCISLCLLSWIAVPQCDPLGPDECPDPENNGQVCPDTLTPGYLNQFYSVVATILPPAADTSGVTIHHIVLDSVTNLPPGLTWESNAVNNEFYPGIYYCVLMQGTPAAAGTFFLKIYIGVFINFFGTPVYVGQVIDSTSLSMVIYDNTGLADHGNQPLYIRESCPNPFRSWLSIRYYSEQPGNVEFKLYSIVGEQVATMSAVARRGENYFHYQGEDLLPGTYFYILKSGGASAAGKIIKSR